MPLRGIKIHVPVDYTEPTSLQILSVVSDIVQQNQTTMKVQRYPFIRNNKGMTIYPTYDNPEAQDSMAVATNFDTAIQIAKQLDIALKDYRQQKATPYATDIVVGEESNRVAIRYGQLRNASVDETQGTNDEKKFVFSDGWVDSRKNSFMQNFPEGYFKELRQIAKNHNLKM
ncbi:MAG TPA: hypothetical protein PLS49_02800 [Candidatus Woesebacteria bacterium]|nr:hypothetical protein [Candidatus Woesebacteria bacterium]